MSLQAATAFFNSHRSLEKKRAGWFNEEQRHYVGVRPKVWGPNIFEVCTDLIYFNEGHVLCQDFIKDFSHLIWGGTYLHPALDLRKGEAASPGGLIHLDV